METRVTCGFRVGDYRVRFTVEEEDELHIHSVRHRKDAYR